MKKSFFLFLLVCFLPVFLLCTANASALGDADGDGGIYAADARLALRFAVGLDTPDAAQRLSADADHTGDITAGDARLILRNVVGLEAFTHPFDRADHRIELLRPATCVDDGVQRTYCVCGAWRDDTVKKTGIHAYPEAWTVLTAASCTKKGEAEKRCTVCGYRITQKLPAAGHDYSLAETVPAFCTAAGSETKICSRCGTRAKATPLPALGHDYAAAETVPATCAAAGYARSVCTRCGDPIITATFEKKAHVYSDRVETKAHSCTEPGISARVCVNCGAETDLTEVPALGHSYTSSRRVPPTCTAEGYTVLVCERCGEEAAPAAIPKLGHDFSKSRSVAATCTADGYTVPVCSRCGAEGERTVIPKLRHRYSAVKIVAATCTAGGYEEKTCSLCGHVLTTPTDGPLGHDFVLDKTTIPDCEAGGEKLYVCAVCGETRSEKIPAAGHTAQTVPGTPPACLSKGTGDAVVCSVCGKVLQAPAVIDALGHSFSDWAPEPETGVLVRQCTRCGAPQSKDAGCAHAYQIVSSVPATCETAGETVKTCTKCGSTVRALIPPTGHAYEDKVTAPTCTAGGYTEHTCKNCGRSYRDAETAASGHAPQTVNAVSPTCAAAGYSGDTVCKTCGKLLESGKTLSALPHEPAAARVTEKATCTTAGKSVVCCAVCGETLSEETLPALGHDPQTRYSEDGATRLTVCARCGKTLETHPLCAVRIAPDGTRQDIYELLPALQNAAAGDTLALVKDAVLPASAEISPGVTLVVPCFAGDTGFTADGNIPDAHVTEPGDTKRLYCTLTVPKGVTLTVRGTLLVNAETGRRISAPGADQNVAGGYGEVALAGDITVKNGGSFVCAGFVNLADPAAGGAVTLEPGAALCETLAVRRFRGASNAVACAALGIWPVPETELASVRAKLIVHAGASLIGSVKLFFAAGTEEAAFHSSDFVVIGENGLVRLASGARAEREIRSASAGEVSGVYSFCGGAVFGSARFTFSPGAYLDTGDFWYPVNGTVACVLYDGAYQLGADFMLLPGGSVCVKEGAALTVPADAGLALAGDEYYEKDAGTGVCAYPAGRDPAVLTVAPGGSATVQGILAGTVVSAGTLSAAGAAREATVLVPDALPVSAADKARYITVIR